MKNEFIGSFAVLPLRDIVMFPGMVAPLFVGRKKSINALEKAVSQKKELVFVTQKDASKENPEPEDLYSIGVLGNVLQLLKLPDGTTKVLVEAKTRVELKNLENEEEIYKADIFKIAENLETSKEYDAYFRSVISSFEEYVELNKKVNPEVTRAIIEIKEDDVLLDTITSHLHISTEKKQTILETTNLKARAKKIFKFIESEIDILYTERKIKQRIKDQMEKTQKDYYLNEQMKAIQKEINDTDGKDEFQELENRIKKTKLSPEARDKLLSELKKLKMMNSASAESSIVRNYIDTVLSLPWEKYSKLKTDLNLAAKSLDKDHYGLEKVKERILEYLAVNQRVGNLKGPIICLVGPPGVGKTSLAKSIAKSIGRNYVKFALGGIKDESEIRGHRKTYVGAMPGKILQLMKKAGTSNPVILLDEIDKIGSDYRGDPSFALLEVLDPEQNSKFLDHYLEVEYDLSSVMFIATANSLNIPRPLLDRMEIIRLSGYTEEEKTHIALDHLIEKEKTSHGLKQKEISISQDAIIDIIRYYTREAGVRGLDKEIAKICRKVLKQIMTSKDIKNINIDSNNLESLLGIKRFDYGKIEEENAVGLTNGLAYTEVGGELLYIEAALLPGKGDIKMTGKLGEVMQESAKAAFSYFCSKSFKYGVLPENYQKKDIHIHVPEGATPKDGPSAGIALFTTIVSIMNNIKVKQTVAMTGEITLRGKVLPIGGLKEKLLAALRAGIKTVIIPEENRKNLEEMPETIIKNLQIIPVTHVDEVLDIALEEKINPLNEDMISTIKPNIDENKNGDDLLRH